MEWVPIFFNCSVQPKSLMGQDRGGLFRPQDDSPGIPITVPRTIQLNESSLTTKNLTRLSIRSRSIRHESEAVSHSAWPLPRGHDDEEKSNGYPPGVALRLHRQFPLVQPGLVRQPVPCLERHNRVPGS